MRDQDKETENKYELNMRWGRDGGREKTFLYYYEGQRHQGHQKASITKTHKQTK